MGGQKSIWSYIRGHKFNRLLFKNFAYVFVLVTVPLLLVLSLNYGRFSDVVNKRVLDMNEELLQQSAVVTDNIMVGLLDDLNQISQHSAVMEIVQMDASDETYNQKVAQVIEMVNRQIESSNLIMEAYIYSDVNEMLIDGSGAKEIYRVANKEKWYYIHKQTPMVVPYTLLDEGSRFYMCQPIWSLKGQSAGLFVLEVNFRNIRDVLESQDVAQQGVFLVMDISGQTIYCSEQTGSGTSEVVAAYEQSVVGIRAGESQLVDNHGIRIVSVQESIHKSWKYAFITKMPDYEDELGAVHTFLLSSVSVGVITSLIVACVITVLTYRPVRKIVEVIQNPQLHWNEKEATKKSNELLYITSNILADRNADKDISDELGDRIRSLRQAQFRALQFQIDPHFLYNTLETIKWNAVEEIGLGNKTSKMLTKVARLYRLGLENDDVIVSLKEELEFLKLYIEIVKIRFGESITFHWNIDESLKDCTIIKMCLQPIVENAIQHGLRPKNYRGNITVSAYVRKENLCICIENDGQEMSQTEINRLNQKLKTGAGFEESKVGLRNVNERIKLIYGRKYGVRVERSEAAETNHSESGGNIRVVLTFPCRNFNRSEETK